MISLDTGPAFPATENLGKSEDGTEYIYGGSVAINRTLGYLRDTASIQGATPWRLFLINVYSLVDNVFSTQLTVKQVKDAFHAEVNILTQYIEAYAASLPGPYKTPTIIFYVPQYSVIPTKYRRTIKPGTNRDRLDKFYLQFKSSDISSRPELLTGLGAHSQQWTVPVGGGSFPHRDLVTWLRGQSPKFSYIFNHDPVALITHCPIDLHIHRILGNVSLMERYTGQVVTPKDFGKKLHASDVPFNIYTHRVFGDKVHLAPMIQGKVKKALVEKARLRRWMQQPPQSILSDIREVTGITPQEISDLRM